MKARHRLFGIDQSLPCACPSNIPAFNYTLAMPHKNYLDVLQRMETSSLDLAQLA